MSARGALRGSLALSAVALALAHGCAGGSESSGAGGSLVCAAGLTACGGACVDVVSNPDHCGRCGSPCGSDQACAGGSCVPVVCAPGEVAGCYTGPEATLGVGPCKGGTWTCDESGAAYGPCEGEVIPVAEDCGTLEDDDCDGAPNGGCIYAKCADLPAGAESGVVLIDPDGDGPVEPFEVHCEMEVEGGGWTLVASVADGAYFNDTFCSRDCSSGAQIGACDESPFTAEDVAGDVAEHLVQDHKSRAYATVPFREMMFLDSGGQYATYEISSALQASVADWYPEGLESYVALGVEAHPLYSYPVKATNVPLASNNCGTLRLSFNVEDSDTPVGAPCHETKKGPCWAKSEGDGCYWDEAGVSWVHDAFYRGNGSTSRRWFVR
jgi:hypothetical protein